MPSPDFDCPFPVGTRVVVTPTLGAYDIPDPLQEGFSNGVVVVLEEMYNNGYDDETGEDVEGEFLGWEMGVSFDGFRHGHSLSHRVSDSSGFWIFYEPYQSSPDYTIAREDGTTVKLSKRPRYSTEREYAYDVSKSL